MKFFLTTVLLSLNVLYGGIAQAAPAQEFSISAFESSKNSNSPVAIGFHSPSCGSCKVQKPNFEAVLNEPEFSELKGYLADFDSSKSFRKTLTNPVRGPSTIVIFKNGQEVDRILGVTNKDEIREILRRSI